MADRLQPTTVNPDTIEQLGEPVSIFPLVPQPVFGGGLLLYVVWGAPLRTARDITDNQAYQQFVKSRSEEQILQLCRDGQLTFYLVQQSLLEGCIRDNGTIVRTYRVIHEDPLAGVPMS